MNLEQFFEHWGIAENPFRGEEARRDSVFLRVGLGPGSSAIHPDFEKILGEVERPTTAVVFGEKGSGKTAIRMQIADRVARANERSPGRRTLLIEYDELNGFLDQLHERATRGGKKLDPGDSMRKVRLVDHLDAVVTLGTARVVKALIGGAGDPPPADLGQDPVKAARKMSPGLKQDLVLLEALYDRADTDGRRVAALRSRLRMPAPGGRLGWLMLAWIGWLPAALGAGLYVFGGEVVEGVPPVVMQIAIGVLALAWVGVLGKVLVWDRFVLGRTGARVWKQLRFLAREPQAYAASLVHVDTRYRAPGVLPMNSSDEHRYAMLDRLRRVLAHFGYAGMTVVMDRIDEPTLVNGDAERMRAIVWPLLNNKLLQQDGLGFKLLLPIELRHALFKESSAFFQEARLDKQSMIERLSWTGPMLYDLCNARLAACRRDGAEEVALRDLFEEDVSRQDLIDAFDQMHQPRDAFKFIYRCLTEHCSNVSAEQAQWKIPRLVLDQVRRAESDRVQQFYRGIRPG